MTSCHLPPLHRWPAALSSSSAEMAKADLQGVATEEEARLRGDTGASPLFRPGQRRGLGFWGIQVPVPCISLDRGGGLASGGHGYQSPVSRHLKHRAAAENPGLASWLLCLPPGPDPPHVHPAVGPCDLPFRLGNTYLAFVHSRTVL